MRNFLAVARFASVIVSTSVAPFEAADVPGSAFRHGIADNGTHSNPLFDDEPENPDIIHVGDDDCFAGTTMHMNPTVQVTHPAEHTRPVTATSLGASPAWNNGAEFKWKAVE